MGSIDDDFAENNPRWKTDVIDADFTELKKESYPSGQEQQLHESKTNTGASIGRKIISLLKNAALFPLGLIVMALLILLPVIFFIGAKVIGELILPWLFLASVIVLIITVFILGPLAIPRATRSYAGRSMYFASYVFGVTGWFVGVIITWDLWGTWAVFLGLIIMGWGCVPMALLAALFAGQWSNFFFLLILVILAYGLRLAGLFLDQPRDN